MALVAAVAFALGGLAATKVQGAFHKAEIATLEKNHAKEAAAQAYGALAEIIRLTDVINGIDEDGYKALMAQRADADRLQRQLGDGTLSLSARVTSCDRVVSATSGVDDGSAIARLDGATSQSLAAIAADGDRAIIKMTGLQAYARECAKVSRSCPIKPTDAK